MAAQKAGATTAGASPDLGRSTLEVALDADGIAFPAGQRLSWADARKIAASETRCYLVESDGIHAAQVFSETTQWQRSLMPTRSAPTTLVAGFPMHRIKDTDPLQDTRQKIAALAPLTGAVLDTATGLGYTAIEAARTASHVTTIELDPAALDLARLNPWSRDLFDNPKITQIIGDAFEEIQRFPDGAFAAILHDPPTLSLAGELYSEAFYREAWRILARRGRFFHYIGDPASVFGKRTTAGVLRRLSAAGFKRIVRAPAAFGVVAHK